MQRVDVWVSTDQALRLVHTRRSSSKDSGIDFKGLCGGFCVNFGGALLTRPWVNPREHTEENNPREKSKHSVQWKLHLNTKTVKRN